MWVKTNQKYVLVQTNNNGENNPQQLVCQKSWAKQVAFINKNVGNYFWLRIERAEKSLEIFSIKCVKYSLQSLKKVLNSFYFSLN